MSKAPILRRPEKLAACEVETKIDAKKVERIFRCAFREAARGRGRQLPSGIDFEAIASQLRRPWVAEYQHGRWELMLAIRVVLDDGPKIVEAERRNVFSAAAHRRADAYDNLVRAAQALSEVGISIPARGDRPPKTKQARAVANPDYKEWRFVFAVVNKELGGAQGKRAVGKTEDSLAVVISCNLLAELGFVKVTPAGLSKMLKRSEAARPKMSYDRSFLNEIANIAPNRDK